MRHSLRRGGALGWFQLFALILPGMLLWGLLTPIIMRLGQCATRWIGRHCRCTCWRGGHVRARCVAVSARRSVAESNRHSYLDRGFLPLSPDQHHLLLRHRRRHARDTIRHLARERMVAAASSSRSSPRRICARCRHSFDPHFLFNTLNTIAELVHRDPEAADKMISRLGALLRRSFDHVWR